MDIEKALERLNFIHTSVKIAQEYGARIDLNILRLEIEIIQGCLKDKNQKAT